jgi:hypothetical protein
LPASVATIAEYYRFGIEAGLLTTQDAVAWCDAVIAAEVAPAGEFIELGWCKDASAAIECLKMIQGERDTQLAGKWLLGLLGQRFRESVIGISTAVRMGMQISRAAQLGDELYYDFDSVEDEHFLAKTGQYGTVPDCRNVLEEILAKFQPPPTWTGI